MSRRGLMWVCVAMLLLAEGCRGGKDGPGDPPPGRAGFYGSALAADDLANWKLGTSDQYEACFRWRAKRSGALTAIRPFFIWSTTKPGYHSGTGGTIRIQLQPDDGTDLHLPSGTVLATVTHPNPVHLVDPDTFFYPLLTFPQPATVQEGQLYHLLFTNVDADPVNNWVSVNSAGRFSGFPRVAQVPSAVIRPSWSWIMPTAFLRGRVTWSSGAAIPSPFLAHPGPGPLFRHRARSHPGRATAWC